VFLTGNAVAMVTYYVIKITIWLDIVTPLDKKCGIDPSMYSCWRGAGDCCQPPEARKTSYLLTSNGQRESVLLYLVSLRTGPLPLQVSGNIINWGCPDRIRGKRHGNTSEEM